jgi:hypothetical protein
VRLALAQFDERGHEVLIKTARKRRRDRSAPGGQLFDAFIRQTGPNLGLLHAGGTLRLREHAGSLNEWSAERSVRSQRKHMDRETLGRLRRPMGR